MEEVRAAIIIPARYASSRLPGKPIKEEMKLRTGKYLIEHVYDNARGVCGVDRIIVATDDRRIFDVVNGFGGEAMMTSPHHQSGTDRIAEAAANLPRNIEIIVNIQGDEPDVHPAMVEELITMLRDDPNASMGTLANRIEQLEELSDPNAVKVIIDNNGYALYFSRAAIPFVRDCNDPFAWLREAQSSADRSSLFLKHLGIYSYRRNFLLSYSKLPRSSLEEAEKLEQLRALANGYKIKVGITEHRCLGIDTQEDFDRFVERYRR